MKNYRKKPITIQAMQFTDIDMLSELRKCFPEIDMDWKEGGDGCPYDEKIFIETLEGKMYVSLNDWIIRGVNGEAYPCKPDIFEKSYEEVE